eukprot:8379933-Alexandrium_andersonii.AAC.1
MSLLAYGKPAAAVPVAVACPPTKKGIVVPPPKKKAKLEEQPVPASGFVLPPPLLPQTHKYPQSKAMPNELQEQLRDESRSRLIVAGTSFRPLLGLPTPGVAQSATSAPLYEDRGRLGNSRGRQPEK